MEEILKYQYFIMGILFARVVPIIIELIIDLAKDYIKTEKECKVRRKAFRIKGDD